jgi:chromosome segregation ATPase
MTPAEEKELDKRTKEADARAMCDIKMVGQIAALKHEVRSLKKQLDAARDAEGRARQHEKVIEMLKAQVKQWETEGQAMMERQKIREHEAEVQRKEVERAMTERNAMEQELGNAPKIIEKQQRLLSKRDERIKDLEDETQTLRQLLKGRTPAKVETQLQVDSASGELQIGFSAGEADPESAAMPSFVPVA